MAVSLTGRKDIIAGSNSLIRDNDIIDIIDIIDEQVNEVTNFAPETLNTLRELAEAINNDENFFITIQNQINTKAPINNPQFTGTVGGITKQMVGLGNVDNTSDSAKPVSTATQTALDLKANQSTTYTKTEVDNYFLLKADKSTTYTKSEVDNNLILKADKATPYTQTEVDNNLILKADKATTYTKT